MLVHEPAQQPGTLTCPLRGPDDGALFAPYRHVERRDVAHVHQYAQHQSGIEGAYLGDHRVVHAEVVAGFGAEPGESVGERMRCRLHDDVHSAIPSKRVFLSSIKFARTFSLPDKRELHGFGFTHRVDLALPEGDYVVVAHKAVSGNVVSTERVMMQREDDAWKLIGYHVNKNAQTSIE